MSGDLTARESAARVLARWSAGASDLEASDFDVADDILDTLAAAGYTIVTTDPTREEIARRSADRCRKLGGCTLHPVEVVPDAR